MKNVTSYMQVSKYIASLEFMLVLKYASDSIYNTLNRVGLRIIGSAQVKLEHFFSLKVELEALKVPI